MAGPDPQQLLDLARREMNPPGQLGAPRQVDLRRAMSTAYYAAFHCLCGAIADEFAGGSGQVWNRFYRAVDHGHARERCQRLVGVQGAHSGLVSFANDFIQLQQLRHEADYNPEFRASKQAAAQAVARASAAIASLQNADREQRRVFLVDFLVRQLAGVAPFAPRAKSA